MKKYKVQMINKYTGAVEEDCMDDIIFDSESGAVEYACYMQGCASDGSETLKMSNPFDYEEDYSDNEDYEYIAVEID